jgi:hypothetical protein
VTSASAGGYRPLLAHGIGEVKDLPDPGWLFLYGAAVVLVLSFGALGLLWSRPRLEGSSRERPLPAGLQRVARPGTLRVATGTFSVALLVLVTLTALFGTLASSNNFAPNFVYVVFWLGLVPVVALLGDVWPLLNPWKAVADAVAWVGRQLGASADPLAAYPPRLGRWPAAVLLFAFATLELAYFDSADPRAVGVAVLCYSGIAWAGAAVFGTERWFANGEAFTVYFGLLARVAPFGRSGNGRELVARPPFVGLTVRDRVPGTLPILAVMLGSVAFDGLSRTVWWQDRQLEAVARAPEHADALRMAVNTVGLLGAVVAVARAYGAAVGAARAGVGSRASLTDAFLMSLVPIALVYAVSHYFSLLVVQGQFTVSLASDPFGWGWDLFGTRGFRPNLAPISPSVIWYVQVGVLVAGHVIGLVLAHDRALALF